MATRKSDKKDGVPDKDATLDPAAATPPDLVSDPIEPDADAVAAPSPTDAERRTLDTFAAEPTPDEYAGRDRAETEAPSPWGASASRDAALAPEPDLSPDASTSDPHASDPHASDFAARDRSFDEDDHDRPSPTPSAATPAQSEPASFATTAPAAPPSPAPRKSSFAGRALTALILLIAGAALGVWGAPRLAPMLPAGMEPVAAWLAPGRAEADARLAAVESSVAQVSTQVAAAPTADAVAAQVQSLVDSARADVDARIAEIQAALDRSDFTDANERIGRLETSIGGATAELASLRDQISAGAATAGEDASASVDAYRAELDGLRAEVNDLSGAVSGLSAELQEATTAAAARAAAAEEQAQQVQEEAVAERDLAAAQADVAAIRAALANGGSFADPLAALATNAGVTPPAGLEAAAATGVQTLAQLRASFSDQAHEAIRASIVAGAGDGVIARAQAFLASNVASRSLEPQEGASPDAVLSRVEDALRRDDLAAALTETEQLPSEAQAALADWTAAAKLRADAEAGLAEVSSSVAAMN